MTNIDRRRFVSTIGALAVCTAAAPAVGGADAGASLKTRISDEKDENYGWYIARQQLDHQAATSEAIRQHVVDFWSKPLAAISLADYLPSEISRGVLWFDGFGQDKTFAEQLEYIDSVHNEHNYAWIEEPRFVAACLNDNNLLSSTLRSLIADDRSAHALLRTTLLHLDSMSPATNEPEWAQIIPALAPCYDRIVGYYDMQERGLRHLRAWWDDNENQPSWEKSYFKQSICDPASQCDAVVFISPALIETDPGLCPSASTETLAGELIRRFGYAALDRAVFNEIVGSEDGRMKRRPRLYALASVTIETPGWHHFIAIRKILDRQRRLVSGSFGDLALDGTPIVVAITVRDQQLRRPFIYEYRDPSGKLKSCFEVRVPTYQSPDDDTLKLIALWPFKLDAVEEKIGGMA
jgi:hypothetical protein